MTPAASVPRPVVAGYRIPPVADVRSFLATIPKGVQTLRADRVYGADHLRHAAALAARAVAEGRARTVDVATETALYAAGERQIGKALAFLGVETGTTAVAAIAWESLPPGFTALAGWTRDDEVISGGSHVLDAFGITHAERAMLPRERWVELVMERVALSDVLKA